jgi:hypothetical protein
MLKTALTIISLLGFTTYALAENKSATDACVDQEQGNVCSYTDEKGNEFNGSCQYDSAKQLFCQAYN